MIYFESPPHIESYHRVINSVMSRRTYFIDITAAMSPPVVTERYGVPFMLDEVSGEVISPPRDK